MIPVTVSALDLGGDQGGLLQNAGNKAGYDVAGTTDTSFSQGIGKIINIVLSLVGVIFTVLMVYAGYLWMTARGKDDQVEKAQDIIRAAIIGIIVTLGAYSITNFVVPRILEATIK
ncbi:MAG: hypothetical protein COU81_02610 [Candidatus Portnoybacteria bacterium CG10_big_fil_rev_8_21_14_0_10_36_7]|uniref:Uncharacterized protein n=1 Tax=Candidatus Portnoybacteria bacterium CG10_big_fil_rev_8_21_14_0_10_36_7 TaxID=1974812 RepID=A0A2M8KDU7_9BACT|nr:MAG: hypothetical protein COU81_02610 [Candidatus Portnoybacteria bacterium CG10_big_fil_rev_8_21_14_0_10_36_7]